MPQQRSPDGVRQERTGWRDEWFSNRHRLWGLDAPIVDLDYVESLAVYAEYDGAIPRALIEAKHYRAEWPPPMDKNNLTLLELANGYSYFSFREGIPFCMVRYWPETACFCVLPVNQQAAQWFTKYEFMCEREFVRRLYEIRLRELPQDIAARLSKDTP